MRRLGSERYSRWLATAQGFEQLAEVVSCGRLEGRIEALHVEPRIDCKPGKLLADQIRGPAGILAWNRAPLDGETAFAGNDILRRAAMNQSNVQRGKGRIECGILAGRELLRDALQPGNYARRVIDGRPSLRRKRAVRFFAADDDLSERVALPCPDGPQTGRFADDGVARPHRLFPG